MRLVIAEKPSVAQSLSAVLEQGRVRTPDIGGVGTTAEVTDAVIAGLRS